MEIPHQPLFHARGNRAPRRHTHSGTDSTGEKLLRVILHCLSLRGTLCRDHTGFPPFQHRATGRTPSSRGCWGQGSRGYLGCVAPARTGQEGVGTCWDEHALLTYGGCSKPPRRSRGMQEGRARPELEWLCSLESFFPGTEKEGGRERKEKGGKKIERKREREEERKRERLKGVKDVNRQWEKEVGVTGKKEERRVKNNIRDSEWERENKNETREKKEKKNKKY